MANSMGVPSPPLRIIAPSGAPSTKSTKMYAGTRRLGLMDAFHFATALDVGCEAMISNDQKLIRQTGLDVIGLDDLIAN